MVGIILAPDTEDAAHCAIAALLDREREVTLPLADRRPQLRLTIRRDIQASARLFPFGESLTKRLCGPCDRKRPCSDSEARVDSPKQRLDRRLQLFLRRRWEWERGGVARIGFLAVPDAGDAIAAEIALVVIFRILEDLDVAVLILGPVGLVWEAGLRAFERALSRCRAASAKCRHLRNCQAAATAVRHVVIAAARSTRCVWAEVRWRWTLKVLWTAAWVERNFWAEPGLLNRCILRSRRRVG